MIALSVSIPIVKGKLTEGEKLQSCVSIIISLSQIITRLLDFTKPDPWSYDP